MPSAAIGGILRYPAVLLAMTALSTDVSNAALASPAEHLVEMKLIYEGRPSSPRPMKLADGEAKGLIVADYAGNHYNYRITVSAIPKEQYRVNFRFDGNLINNSKKIPRRIKFAYDGMLFAKSGDFSFVSIPPAELKAAPLKIRFKISPPIDPLEK